MQTSVKLKVGGVLFEVWLTFLLLFNKQPRPQQTESIPLDRTLRALFKEHRSDNASDVYIHLFICS